MYRSTPPLHRRRPARAFGDFSGIRWESAWFSIMIVPAFVVIVVGLTPAKTGDDKIGAELTNGKAGNSETGSADEKIDEVGSSPTPSFLVN